jgi:chaperonin GroEL
MSKQVTYAEQIRQSLLREVNRLADAVRVTLGHKGRNVLPGKKSGASPRDGATATKDTSVKENLGAQR